MGLYATTTAINTRMVGVNFDADTTTLCSAMIDDAEAEVNKYLSKRYDLTANTFQTTTGIPPLVRQLTQRLSEGYMWQAMSRGSKESLTRAAELKKEVFSNLSQIADYKLDLVATNGSVIVDMSQSAYRVLVNTDTYNSTFNEDDELSWAVNSDKLEDISDDRD